MSVATSFFGTERRLTDPWCQEGLLELFLEAEATFACSHAAVLRLSWSTAVSIRPESSSILRSFRALE